VAGLQNLTGDKEKSFRPRNVSLLTSIAASQFELKGKIDIFDEPTLKHYFTGAIGRRNSA
jgi:hypothetical protein